MANIIIKIVNNIILMSCLQINKRRIFVLSLMLFLFYETFCLEWVLTCTRSLYAFGVIVPILLFLLYPILLAYCFTAVRNHFGLLATLAFILLRLFMTLFLIYNFAAIHAYDKYWPYSLCIMLLNMCF